MAADSAAETVLSYYSLSPPLVRRIEPLGNAGGWSGSRIWKVYLESSAVGNALRGVSGTDAPPEFLCLRRWPREHPSPERLRLIHDVLRRVWEGGLHLVPVPLCDRQGATFVDFQCHLWELAPWMPGTADFHANPTRERLRAAMSTLAQFHRLASDTATIGHPASLHERIILSRNLLGGLAETVPPGIRLGIEPRLDQVASRVYSAALPMLPAIRARLGLASSCTTTLQPAIRDVWHDHLLFTGEQLTGIVDFGSLRIDTPLTDLARLIGSLVADDAAARRFALDCYATVRPLSEEDRSLIDLLDQSGVVLAGLNWLTWLYVDHRDMGPTDPIVRRLDEILLRLEHLTVPSIDPS
jgi:Ser/Thr protein kinase RdoA (MazF antagonist)